MDSQWIVVRTMAVSMKAHVLKCAAYSLRLLLRNICGVGNPRN